MNVIRQPDYFDQPSDPAAFAWLPTLFAFLHRRWRTILAWTLAVLLLGVAYVVLATPKYTAEVDVLIDTRQASAFRQQSAAVSIDSQSENAIVESQVEVLRSDGLARTVVRRMGLQDDAEFARWSFSLPAAALRAVLKLVEPPSHRAPSAEDGVSAATEQLSRLVSVKRVGLSNVITVNVMTPNAERSAAIANALVAEYIGGSLAAKEDVTRQAGVWLQDRLKELRDQSIQADRALQQMKARVGLVDTDKGGMNEQQIGDLSLQLANARARVSDAASRFSRIQAITAAGVTSTSSGSVSDALQNTVILKLQQQYLDDARKLAEWAPRFGNGHVAVVQLRAEMGELQRSIGSELGRIQEAYKSDLDVARSNEAAIQKQIDGLVQVATEANGQRVQVRALESMADTYRQLYGSFLQRYTQAAQDQSFPISEARVITAATPPLRKSRPLTLIVLLGATVAGLGLGTVVSFIREVTDRRVQTPAQLRALTGLDTLGMLPSLARVDGVRRPAGPVPPGRVIANRPGILRWVVDQPFSPFSEVVRGLRVRLGAARSRSRPIRVVAAVSAGPGEGKTVLAANLAQALAASGQRCLVIDADCRRPQLTTWWAPNRSAGLREALGGAALDDLLWTDGQTGLAFLPASPGAEGHGADLLGSAAMKDLLGALAPRFDLVVVDLPALSTPADANAVAPLVDGFIVVVEWAQTPEHALVDGLTAADIDAGRLLGCVFNKVDLKAMRRLTAGTGQSYRAFSNDLMTS